MKSCNRLKGKRAKSWRIECLGNLECFPARGLNHRYDRHVHDAYAIGAFESGVGCTEYRGTLHRFPPGSLVVMNPGEVHSGYPADDRPLTYRMLYVAPDTLRAVLLKREQLPFFSSICIRDSYWSNRIIALHQILETSNETLSEFLEVFTEASSCDRPLREFKAVERIKECLNIAYPEAITINDLVELTRLDRAYPIRSFRRIVGIPPHLYLIQVRVKQAKRLLAAGMPIAQVACEVGFADQSHLARRFKRMTGLTPRQYAVGHFRSI